eukprot:4133272-Alexandrium_andersonii.AAC.1
MNNAGQRRASPECAEKRPKRHSGRPRSFRTLFGVVRRCSALSSVVMLPNSLASRAPSAKD